MNPSQSMRNQHLSWTSAIDMWHIFMVSLFFLCFVVTAINLELADSRAGLQWISPRMIKPSLWASDSPIQVSQRAACRGDGSARSPPSAPPPPSPQRAAPALDSAARGVGRRSG